MSDGLRVGRGVEIPLHEITVRASRSSGPGGQHANVTASRIEAVWEPAGSEALDDALRARVLGRCGPRVTAVAQDARSQARNREVALERLRQRIMLALEVPRPRRATRPTAASRRARADAKRRRSDMKRSRRRPDPSDRDA